MKRRDGRQNDVSGCKRWHTREIADLQCQFLAYYWCLSYTVA